MQQCYTCRISDWQDISTHTPEFETVGTFSVSIRLDETLTLIEA